MTPSAEAPPPAEPIVPPPAAGLISAAPVGWGAPQQPGVPAAGAAGSDIATPAVGWGSPEPTGRDVPGAPGFVFASTLTRLVAYLIDLFVSWLIGLTIAAIVVAVLYSSNVVSDQSARSSYISGVLVWVIALLFELAYFVFFWSGGRRSTPGQRLFQIQVGNAVDGQQLDVTQAAVRWLGYGQWLVVFGFLPALSRHRRARLVRLALPPADHHDHQPDETGPPRPHRRHLARQAGIGGLERARARMPDPDRAARASSRSSSIVGLIFLGSQVSTILSAVGESV